jgi:hypothetical protein
MSLANEFVLEFERWNAETGALPRGGHWMNEVSEIIQRAAKDAGRLDWMAERGAWIAWSKDYECCRVFMQTDDGPAPVLGWGSGKASHTAREAIDACMHQEGK